MNPDPDAPDDTEIDIVKQIFTRPESPSAPDSLPEKFPGDTSSIEFYDEEESTGEIFMQRKLEEND